MNNLLHELLLFKRGIYKRSIVGQRQLNNVSIFDAWVLINDWDGIRFEKCQVDNWIYGGVYLLIDDSSNVDDPIFYIGQSKNIYKRIIRHLNDKKSPFYRLSNIGCEDEKPLLIKLSADISDERYFYRMMSESEFFRPLNHPSKLLKYN